MFCWFFFADAAALLFLHYFAITRFDAVAASATFAYLRCCHVDTLPPPDAILLPAPCRHAMLTPPLLYYATDAPLLLATAPRCHFACYAIK